MVQTFGQVLPLAVFMALSTVPILVTITLLLGAQTTASSVTFVVGWLVGMFGVVGALFLGANALPELSDVEWPLIGWVEIIIGLALVAYSVVSFLRRHRARGAAGSPRWLSAISAIRPLPALGLALALCLRPKAFLVSSAAAIAVAAGELLAPTSLVLLLLFVAIGGSSVLVPVVISLVRPNAMRRPLEKTQSWITANNRAIAFVAALLTGIFVLGHGLTEL